MFEARLSRSHECASVSMNVHLSVFSPANIPDHNMKNARLLELYANKDEIDNQGIAISSRNQI